MVAHIANQYYDQESIVAEPWPADAKLYQPNDDTQILLPESASCLAVKTYLKMCNLDYEVKTCANAEFMSPGGRMTKVPFLQCGAFVIPEMEHIVSFVESKGKSLTDDLKLDADEKSDLRAYFSLTDNIFSHAEMYISWIDKTVLEKVTLIRNGSVFPWPLNHIQNYRKKQQVLRHLKVYEWSDITIDEVAEKVSKCCENLCEKLGDKLFTFGDLPTELDALIFGHIYTILTTDLPNNILAQTVKNFPKLMAFCERVDRTYFAVRK